jgi:hypothetical protein
MMKKLKKSDLEREKAKNKKSSVKQAVFDRVTLSRSKTACLTMVFIFEMFFSFGCQPNQTILKDVPPPSPTPLATAETQKTSFEQDLKDMQAANFDYIFVFRRKDGGVFDSDDRKYLRQNTPPETNRWTSTDDGKAFIAGSGFAFSPQNMEALRNRFIVEDYSKPEIKEVANNTANANANTNANKTVKPQANK